MHMDTVLTESFSVFLVSFLMILLAMGFEDDNDDDNVGVGRIVRVDF